MRRFLKITGIGCGGLIALIIVLGIVGALIGGQDTTSQRSDSAKQSDTSSQTTQSASAAKEPAPINLSGSGQMATNPFDLGSGLAVFRMTHQGGSNFIVHLIDENGAKATDPLGGTLANKIGPFEGSVPMQAKAGNYVLDVQASGPWTITIEQPRPSSAPATTSFSGNSTTATDLFSLSKGRKTFEMTHQGSQNFIVTLRDKNGAKASDPLGGTLVNEIGPFNGSKVVGVPKDDIYILQVEANGPWTINVT